MDKCPKGPFDPDPDPVADPMADFLLFPESSSLEVWKELHYIHGLGDYEVIISFLKLKTVVFLP